MTTIPVLYLYYTCTITRVIVYHVIHYSITEYLSYTTISYPNSIINRSSNDESEFFIKDYKIKTVIPDSFIIAILVKPVERRGVLVHSYSNSFHYLH